MFFFLGLSTRVLSLPPIGASTFQRRSKPARAEALRSAASELEFSTLGLKGKQLTNRTKSLRNPPPFREDKTSA